MTQFEYISVIMAIFLSMSIAQMLRAMPSVLRKSSRSLLHVCWYVLALFSHTALWWNFWFLNSYTQWTYGIFLFSLIPALLLYLIGQTLVSTDFLTVDSWEEHLKENGRALYGCFSVLYLYFLFPSLVITGNWFPSTFANVSNIAVGVAFAVCAYKPNRILEYVLAFVMLLGTIGPILIGYPAESLGA